MIYTAYYIIRPRPELAQILGGMEHLKDLLGPELWTHEHGGRTTMTVEDHIPLVKRLFVAYTRHLVLSSAGSPPALDLDDDEAAFDRWWALEVFDGEDNSAEDAAEALRSLDRPELAELLSHFRLSTLHDPPSGSLGVQA